MLLSNQDSINRAEKLLSSVEAHEILIVMNGSSNHNTKMEKLMTMTANIKSTWLASFRNLTHV